MRKSIIATSTAALILSMLPHPADAASVGKKCSKRGVERVVGNTTLICSGKNKLTWKRKNSRSTQVAIAPKPSATPVPIPTPIATVAPSPAPTIPELPRPTEIGLLKSSAECKLKTPDQQMYQYLDFGFPKSSELHPSKGEFNVLLISVDFLNNRATVSPEENGKPYSEQFVKYWEDMSRGQLKFKIDNLNQWISLPNTAFSYAGPEPHRDMDKYAQEVLDRADPLVDYAKYSIVAIIPPSNVKNFLTNGPVLAYGKFDKYKTQEGPVFNLTVGPEPIYPMGGVKWLWLAHEVGHMLGLGHPHSYEGNNINLMSIFSLMDAGFAAPGLYGWERWRMDWLDDEEIRCIGINSQNKVSVHKIAPLGPKTGAQMGVIKLSDHEAIVFENRRKTNFDQLKSDYEGLSVYFVNSQLSEGAIRPILGKRTITDYTLRGSRIVNTLKPNEFIEFRGIKVKVLAEENKDLLVQVEIPG